MAAQPVLGVTRDNFVVMGKAFMGANGGKGFVITPTPMQHGAVSFPATPRQWGAWMAYWSRLGYSAKSMRERGHATVPAEWPHEFDANATIQGDNAAADAFEFRGDRDVRKRRPPEHRPFRPYPALWAALAGETLLLKALESMTFDQMTRVSKVFATEGVEAVKENLWSIAKAPDQQKRQPTPDSHLRPDAGTSVDVSDFPDANASPEELRDWEARQKAERAA